MMLLKKKVAANFNTAKADAILEKQVWMKKLQRKTILAKKPMFWCSVQVVVLADCWPTL